MSLSAGKRAAFVEFGQPDFEMVLRAGQRGDGAFLGEAGRVAGAVALDGVNGFGDGLGRGAPAQPPAGHAPGFGEAMHDDRVLEVRGREAGDALGGRAVVEEVLVDFVAHDEDVLLDADVAEGFEFVGRIDGAGGVAGGVEDEQARARGDGGAQGVGGELELGLVGGLDDDGLGAGHLHHLRVAQPVGRGDDDFVAFLAGGEDDVEAGVFAAAGDDDLRGLVGEAVLAFVLVGDGLAQLGDAGGGGVFGEAGGERLGDRRL